MSALRAAYVFVRRVAHKSIEADIDVQAAQIAFNAVFSVGPLLTLTTFFLSLVPREQLRDQLRALVVPVAPEAARPLLEGPLTAAMRPPSASLVVLSVFGLLWTLSGAANAIAIALRHMGFRLSDRWLRRRLRALLLGIICAFGFALSAIAASVGPVILRAISRTLHVPLEGLTSVAWMRWPISGLTFGVACSLFVSLGTRHRPRASAVLWGGVTAGAISLAASALLRLYLSHAPSYGVSGTTSALFAGLLWLYVLAFGLLIGAVVAWVLNAGADDASERPTRPDGIRGADD